MVRPSVARRALGSILSVTLLGAAATTALPACGGAAREGARTPTGAELVDGTVPSADGVPIHYVAGGAGSTAIVLVHGWTGDVHFWDAQLPFFSRSHRVVALDLAGHGASGLGRTKYDAASYAADVRAVVDALGLTKIILVGHSMSGNVVLEVAPQLEGRVLAVIGIDSYQNLEEVRSEKEAEEFLAGAKDYPTWVRQFLGTIWGSEAPEQKKRVAEGAAAIPKDRALAMLRWNFSYPTKEAAAKLRVPLGGVNGDKFPTDVAACQRVVPGFRVILVRGTAHYPMLERPDAFNDALALMVAQLTQKPE